MTLEVSGSGYWDGYKGLELELGLGLRQL